MLKQIVKHMIAMFLLGTVAMSVNAKQPMTREEAQLRSNVNSFAVMADQGAYEYLGRLFAADVLVDYTSLFGGEPQTTKREDLMSQWAGFLPGFDTTFHDLSNMKVKIKGDIATATADFTASHWLESQSLEEKGFWSVSGIYNFVFKRVNDNWQITSIKVVGTGEAGSRDVLAEAPKNAVKNFKARESLKVKLH